MGAWPAVCLLFWLGLSVEAECRWREEESPRLLESSPDEGEGQPFMEGCVCLDAGCSLESSRWRVRCEQGGTLTLARLPADMRTRLVHLETQGCWPQGGGRLFPSLENLTATNGVVCGQGGTLDVSGLSYLKRLHLPGNSLEKVSTDPFRTLDALELLDLGNNSLEDLEWLRTAPSGLKTLFLDGNSISTFPKRVFDRLGHLITLDLSWNHVEELGPDAFEGLQLLQMLSLRGNPLEKVHPDAFKATPDLRWLDLSETLLVSLSSSSSFPLLSSNVLLSSLFLSRMPRLKSVSSHDLGFLARLRVLRLNGNPQLSLMEEEVFANLSSLQWMDLSGNNLTHLPASVSALTALKELAAGENPWRCECQLLFLQEMEKDENETTLECYSDEETESMPLELFLHENCSWPMQAGPINSLYSRHDTSALLHCQASRQMRSKRVSWITPHQKVLSWAGKLEDTDERDEKSNQQHLQLLHSGSLFIQKVLLEDLGRYTCMVSSSLRNASSIVILRLDAAVLEEVKLLSILVGMITGLIFLLFSMIFVLIKLLAERNGWCLWLSKDKVPTGKNLRHILYTVEHCRMQQLEKLRENYHSQVQRIRENFAQQVERIRDSYSGQVQHLKDFRNYGTQQLTMYRLQYQEQVKRVRSYSMSQLGRVRENYVYQRNRVRKFSADQFIRLRESYKFQQQTLVKIIENFPVLYLDNCRTGMCQRTESIVFDEIRVDVERDPEASSLEEIAVGTSSSRTVRSEDQASMSEYYTPTEHC